MSSSELHNMMANFEYLMNSPAVVKLNKKVSKLKKQVKVLNRVILHLGKSLDVNGDNKSNIIDLTEELVSDEECMSLVYIKTEPVSEEDDQHSSSDEEEGIRYNITDDIKACNISSLVSDEEEVEESDDEEEEVEESEEEVEVEESEEEVEVEESEEEVAVEESEEEVEVEESDEEVEVEVEVEESEEEVEVEVEESEEEEEVEVEVEESEEEEEVEVEVEESEEEEEVEVEVEESEEEEEEEEVYEISLNGKSYYTTDANNGDIYAVTEDEDVGDVVGKFVGGKPVMN
jgi:hypothetical protein